MFIFNNDVYFRLCCFVISYRGHAYEYTWTDFTPIFVARLKNSSLNMDCRVSPQYRVRQIYGNAHFTWFSNKNEVAILKIYCSNS